MNKSIHLEEYESQTSIISNERSPQCREERTGTTCIRVPKVTLCSVKTSEKESSQTLAMLSDWDTLEAIDGYNLYELRQLQQKLDDAVQQLINNDPNQLSLF